MARLTAVTNAPDAMEAAAQALGPQHLVTEVVRAEYKAAVHLRLCQGMPVVRQLADARLRGQATFRALVQLQSKMTATAAWLEQTLMTRSRQIAEEMELQEKLRWERAEIDSLINLVECEERRHLDEAGFFPGSEEKHGDQDHQ